MWPLTPFLPVYVRICDHVVQTPPLVLPPHGDVITLGVPHFLTLREPEPVGRGVGVDASEEVFKQEHMFPHRLCMGGGAPILHTSQILQRKCFPPRPVPSSLSCHHGSSCQGLSWLLRSGCGRMPGPVASRNRILEARETTTPTAASSTQRQHWLLGCPFPQIEPTTCMWQYGM